MTMDEVVAAYIKLRNTKSAIKAEAEDKCKSLDESLLKLEGWIKEQADAAGVTSFKTKSGTAFLTTVDYASVADWDAVLQFVKDNEAFDMLQKSVSKAAVRGYIEANKAVPAGVNYGTRIEVSVRKPTNKAED